MLVLSPSAADEPARAGSDAAQRLTSGARRCGGKL